MYDTSKPYSSSESDFFNTHREHPLFQENAKTNENHNGFILQKSNQIVESKNEQLNMNATPQIDSNASQLMYGRNLLPFNNTQTQAMQNSFLYKANVLTQYQAMLSRGACASNSFNRIGYDLASGSDVNLLGSDFQIQLIDEKINAILKRRSAILSTQNHMQRQDHNLYTGILNLNGFEINTTNFYGSL